MFPGVVANTRLRDYVQARLAGEVVDSDGRSVGPLGPAWKGRNKPHRGDRRWATAWSQEQIANRLKIEFPDDESMPISHEAIYQALYVEGRGALNPVFPSAPMRTSIRPLIGCRSGRSRGTLLLRCRALVRAGTG